MILKTPSTFICLAITAILFACSEKKETSTSEFTDTLATESKTQIKAFWDIYRIAQKSRIEGNWPAAASAYEEALVINPAHEDARFNLGNMYLELNQGAKAESCWINITDNNPNSARAHMQLGRLYLSFERPETFDMAKAEYEFKTAAAINRLITGPLVQLGYAALLKGENDAAYAYFQSVTGTDTKSVEPHFLSAYLAWKKGETAKMKTHIEKAYALATAGQTGKKDISEGDTKDGISHLRPINESPFNDFYKDLDKIEEPKLTSESIVEFKKLDLRLSEIRKQINV